MSVVLLVALAVMPWIIAASLAMSGDHSAMLRLVATWNCTDPSWTAVNLVCNWAGVTCTGAYCRVSEFVWNQMACTGTVNLTSLPTMMTTLYLSDNQFSGPVDLTSLPTMMTYLDLDGNQFSGPLDLSRLPAVMSQLFLNYNQFSGPIPNLSSLPTGIYLDLYGTDFCGSTGIDIPCDDALLDSNCTCALAAV